MTGRCACLVDQARDAAAMRGLYTTPVALWAAREHAFSPGQLPSSLPGGPPHPAFPSYTLPCPAAAHLPKVFLHKLGAHNADEGGGGVVRHGLGQHGLACRRGRRGGV